MPIDDFFTEPTEPSHPRLRSWRRRLPPLNPSGSATLEVFRPKGAFGPGKPQMFVQFYVEGREADLDEVPWDDDLNAGLISLGVKSISDEKEAERFALGLHSALKETEREFGDGYFNAVLVELINESDLTRHREIAEVMKYTYANKAHREGGAFDRYSICRDQIAGAITARARELKKNLDYPQQKAGAILTLALATYLDERFSVSSRREMGLL